MKQDKANELPTAANNLVKYQSNNTGSHFEAWKMKVHIDTRDGKVKKKFKKIELLRPYIKMKLEEADILNQRLRETKKRVCAMYLLPGEKEEFTLDEIIYSTL